MTGRVGKFVSKMLAKETRLIKKGQDLNRRPPDPHIGQVSQHMILRSR
jgi:hypothetical protein